MARVHEIVARLRAEGQQDYVAGTQEAAESTEEFADTAEESAERAEVAWSNVANVTAGAMAGAGAALEAYNQSQQETRDVSARVGNAIGETSDTVLSAAAEMNNATRDVDELVAMMETGSQRGLESVEDLQSFAATWDTIGDATGENAAALAEASSALNTVGIAAGNEEEAMAALGHVSQNTTASVGDFLSLVERTGKELGDQAPHVNEMAALLSAMEEQGLGAQQAQREVQQALRQSEGDMAAAREELGITNATLDEHIGRVEESSGVIEANAQAHADNKTTLQELSSSLESAMAKYSGLGQAAEMASPLLMGGAAAIFGVNQALSVLRGRAIVATAAKAGLATAAGVKAAAFGVATAATWALNGALAVLTSPITLVVVAIGALIAAAVLLYRNWDEVTEFLGNATEKVMNWVVGKFEWARDGIKNALSSAADWVGNIWNGITDTVRGAVNATIAPINSLIDAFNAVELTLPTIPDWVPIVGGKGGQTIGLPNIPRIPTLGSGAGGRTAHPGGFNLGGRVPGGGPDRDSVLAALTPGEWVLSRRAVEGLGEETIAAIEAAGRRARGGDGLSAADVLFGGDEAGPGLLHRNLGGAVRWAQGEAGKPYGWGAVGPRAYDCSGATSAMTNVAMGQYPHSRRHTTATVGSDPAYALGLQSGIMLGVSSASQLGGIGHMAATVGGMPFESRGSAGVLAGRAARSHADPLFRQRYGHRGYAGEAGAMTDPMGDESNIPFWARPVLDAIAKAIGSAFGVENATWDGGDVLEPGRHRLNVDAGTRDIVSPEPLLRQTVEDALAAHLAGGGITFEEVNISGVRDGREAYEEFKRELHADLARKDG